MWNIISTILVRHKVKKQLGKLTNELKWLESTVLQEKLNTQEIYELVDDILYNMWVNYEDYWCYDKWPIKQWMYILKSINWKISENMQDVINNITKIIDNNNKYVSLLFKVDISEKEGFFKYMDMLHDKTLPPEWFENLIKWFTKNINKNIRSIYLEEFINALKWHSNFTSKHIEYILTLTPFSSNTNWNMYELVKYKRYFINNINQQLSLIIKDKKELINLLTQIILLEDDNTTLLTQILHNLNNEEKMLLLESMNYRHHHNKKMLISIISASIH